MEKDPVCGMAVDPIRAGAQEEHDGKNYFFCCAGCATKFRADPAKYLNQPQSEKKMLAGLVARDELSANAPQPKKRDSGALAAEYICPMDPEVSRDRPGACPKCGMALERAAGSVLPTRIEYTCPMHPEIVRDGPGSCPICGMALEPVTPLAGAANPELASMIRRFWVSLAFSAPLFIVAMADELSGGPVARSLTPSGFLWLQFVLASPVVLWGGAPFFVRGWESIRNRSPNMFTLIALGTGIAYGYSVVAALAPGIVPASFRDMRGQVPA